MTEDTKTAVKKAFNIGKIIFSLSIERYNKLLKLIEMVNFPTNEELNHNLKDNLTSEDVLILELKNRCANIAKANGFDGEQGIAMLEYAAILEDCK